MANRQIRNQKGDSRAMSIFLLIILLIVVLCVWKIGLPFFSYMRLGSFTANTVNYDRQNYTLDAGMMRSMVDRIENRAIDMGIPLTDRGIKIDREGDRAIIEIEYLQPFDLVLFKFERVMRIEKKSEGLGFKLE